MGKLMDLTGQRFGNLLVLERDREKKRPGTGVSFWKCECQCIHKTRESYSSQDLRNGLISCGKCGPTRAYSPRRKVYEAWKTIKKRCLCPKYRDYKTHGGAGITMYPEWINDFEAFFRDVGEPPHEKAVLARKSQSENYEPENLVWVNPGQQQSLYSKSMYYCPEPGTNNSVPPQKLHEKYGYKVPMPVVRARLTARRRAEAKIKAQKEEQGKTDAPPKTKKLIKVWEVEDIFTVPPRQRTPKPKRYPTNKLTLEAVVIRD